MNAKAFALHLLRVFYKGGAWLFDHSGSFAPALARISQPVHEHLFPHSFFVNVLNPIPLEGLRIYHDGRPSYHMQLLAMGMHDRDVAGLLRDLVTPGITVLNVGANIGYFSLLSARLAGPNGTVWAFEPIPGVVEILRKNIEENGFSNQIHVVPQAVSNVSGKTRLYINPVESMLSSLFQEAAMDQLDDPHGHPAYLNCIEVACTTLDAWAAQQNWPTIDLIKIDIEGAEKLALEGMVELCRRNPHLKLIIELNIRTLRAAGATIEEFWATLQNCGFSQISMAGRSLRLVEFPADLPQILQEIRCLGNDRVNLLCEMKAA